MLLVLSLLQTQTHAQVHIYDDTTLDKFSVPIEVAPVNPRQESLSKYTQENEVILIVNIASDPQYAQDNYDELQFLQESFRGKAIARGKVYWQFMVYVKMLPSRCNLLQKADLLC